MDAGVLIKLGLLVIALLASAFFSASEAAYLSIQRGKLAQLMKSDPEKFRRVNRLAGHPEKLLPTVLTGNNLANTAAAALGTGLAISFLRSPGLAVIASTAVVTIVLLVFGETIPKVIAVRHSVGFAAVLAGPLRVVEAVLLPPIWVLGKIVRVVGRIFGVAGADMVSEEEIRALIDMGREAGTVEHSEAQLIENVFRFGDRQLREVMTPRTEMMSLEKGVTLEEFLRIYQQHAHTRFPVYEGSMDNVLGTVSVKDVVQAMAAGRLRPQDDVTQLLRPAYFVPETKLIGDLFRELRGTGYQLVIAADEYGGVAGLATLKQMVEEVVGRVGEEGVSAEEEFQVIDARTYQVDAGMAVEEANTRLALGIPEGNYETVAGFLLTRLGHIPKAGEHLYHNGFLVEVVEMRGVKIEQVKVTRVARSSPGNGQ